MLMIIGDEDPVIVRAGVSDLQSGSGMINMYINLPYVTTVTAADTQGIIIIIITTFFFLLTILHFVLVLHGCFLCPQEHGSLVDNCCLRLRHEEKKKGKKKRPANPTEWLEMLQDIPEDERAQPISTSVS